MGFANLHGVHSHGHTHTKRDSTACPTGGITHPSNGQSIDSLQPLNITWDTSCLSTSAIDIFLYAPGMDVPRIHAWQGAAFAPGYHVVDLMPRWWNSSSTINLQVMMIETGKPPFLSTLSGGPVFSATYTKPADGSTPAAADTSITDNVSVTLLNDLSQPKKKMNSGKTAAAVLLPLLFVALLIGVWLKKQRTKGQEKRREWKEAVDKRMSTISTDWKAMSAAGATAAIRNSMAVNRNSNRASSFSFGPIRPQSTYAVEEEGDDEKSRPKSQMRTGVGLRNPMGTGVGFGAQAERQSRVSFAADTRVSRVSFAEGPRPSLESRKSAGTSRAFHTAILPPMPENAAAVAAAAKKTNGSSDDGTADSDVLSPRQATGALLLTPDEIHHRVAGRPSEDGGIHGGQESYTEVMPALRMIRTSDDNEFLFDVPPTPAPAPAHHKQARSPSYPAMPQTFSTSPPPSHATFDGSYPTSESPQSMSPVMSTQPIPASMMSPDEMLRAYAEKRQRGSLSGTSTATGGFPNTMFSSATPIQPQQNPSPRSSSTGGLLSSLTPKRKKSTKGMNKFGAISSPMISYPTLAAGTGPITDLGAPPVPGQRNDDPFGGPMGM